MKKISKHLLKFLVHETKELEVEEGTDEFRRSLSDIKRKLNKGYKVLTVLNGSPVVILKDSENKVTIKKISKNGEIIG